MYRTGIMSNFLKPNTYRLDTAFHGISWIKQHGHVGSCSVFENGASPNLFGSHDNGEKIPSYQLGVAQWFNRTMFT